MDVQIAYSLRLDRWNDAREVGQGMCMRSLVSHEWNATTNVIAAIDNYIRGYMGLQDE